MTQPILIAGVPGGVGQQLVGKLLSQDQPVRALVRSLAEGQALFGPHDNLQLAEADLSQPDTLPPALAGVRAVICSVRAKAPVGANSPQMVDYEGVRNLVQAAQNAGVSRFALVSTLGVTHPERPLNNFGRALDWKLKGETELRASDLNYTIIRPGDLTDASGGVSPLKVVQGDYLSGGIISRNDVAALCLASLDDIATYRATFEAVTAAEGDPPADLNALFTALKSDRELNVGITP